MFKKLIIIVAAVASDTLMFYIYCRIFGEEVLASGNQAMLDEQFKTASIVRVVFATVILGSGTRIRITVFSKSDNVLV